MSVGLVSRDAWASALDAIEESVSVSEEILAGNLDVSTASAPWLAPAGLGPLPADMRDRAMALLARVAEVERALVESAALTARQLADVRRADPRRRERSAACIDTSC